MAWTAHLLAAMSLSVVLLGDGVDGGLGFFAFKEGMNPGNVEAVLFSVFSWAAVVSDVHLVDTVCPESDRPVGERFDDLGG